MRRTQLIGLLLWRGGLLLASVTVLFESVRWLLKFIDLPLQLEVGLGLGAVGTGLVLVSLILERIQDRRTEGNLSE